MLSQLLAQHANVSISFAKAYRVDPDNPPTLQSTVLQRVRVWSDVFPERTLAWEDWKPVVKNSSTGDLVQYTGHSMSDGEKAALYLAGRVLSGESGVLVVDEPEFHFTPFSLHDSGPR